MEAIYFSILNKRVAIAHVQMSASTDFLTVNMAILNKKWVKRLNIHGSNITHNCEIPTVLLTQPIKSSFNIYNLTITRTKDQVIWFQHLTPSSWENNFMLQVHKINCDVLRCWLTTRELYIAFSYSLNCDVEHYSSTLIHLFYLYLPIYSAIIS